MKTFQVFSFAVVLLATTFGMNSSTRATEFFVSKQGQDSQSGTTRETAFASVQKGVDALQPGDTLTIAPGEYFEAVKRADLGNLDQDTLIRAEIPGTVSLRGDVPAPKFRQLAGHRFVYVADFKFTGNIPALNEIDSLTILKRMPNSSELEFIPGTFFHDAQADKLYISTSDMQPVEAHRYSVSTIPTHGVHLIRPRRVVVEGITVTGFSPMELLHYREETAGGVWGMFVVHGKSCVIRDCRAYLNGWGIGFNSSAPDSGDNIIERCTAWANKSPFANGDMGGLTVFAARRDTIRNSTAFLNGMYGVNIYGTGGAPPNAIGDGNDEKHKSMLESNLAWGNETADIKIKTGYEYFHIAKDCVSPGLWSVTNITNGMIGRGTGGKKDVPRNDILLSDEVGLDLGQEFADPDHYNYRLQATSRFRGTGVQGKDRGPFPYAPTIFYVSAAGDDKADGLSVKSAWKTFARAIRKLQAGDTVYLEPGIYPADATIQAQGQKESPIFVRGRGKVMPILQGSVRLEDCGHMKFERLAFRSGLNVENGNDIVFENCEFIAAGTALEVSKVRGLTLSHNAFAAFKDAAVTSHDGSKVDLRGNLFNNAAGPALKLTDAAQVLYSNYNSYGKSTAAWQVGGKPWTLAEVQKHHDQQSQELIPVYELTESATSLKNAPQFAAGGPFGKPLGPYRDEPRGKDLRLVVKPTVFSVSATTANLEWTTSHPATCQLAWGETPACEKSAAFNVNCFGTYSLTGLKPGQTYYFRIKSVETPRDILPKTELQSAAINDEPITFTTLPQNAAPTVYYVAPDGDDARSGLDRKTAWRSIGHAATKVNVGDTVLIAGGKYFERIRIRATGEAGSPIKFCSIPGERVEINGKDMVLNSGFVAGGKSHLRFDGFYFANFNLFPNDSWSLLNNGEFHLYFGNDIEISRCFSEGRGGYSAYPVTALHIEDLAIRNCVNTYKFGGMYFWRCPNLLIENTVFAEPMIMAFVLRNEKHQKAMMKNCIFTDMLEKKAKLNLGVLCCDGEIDGFLNQNNCYLLRTCFPLEQRALQGNMPIGQLGKYILAPLFADPQFAGDPGVKDNPQDKSGFPPDRMMDLTLKLDFDSFFATNPELIHRDIGLQREAFKDFHFNKSASP
jgi:hypothetical protein